MKKLMLLSLILLLGLITPLIGDEVIAETEDDATLDKVDKKIDKIYDTQQIMYKEQKNSPLDDKKYGIEFNIFRVLQISDYLSLSGGFSMFDVDRNAEISFPIFYYEPEEKYAAKIFTLDCHYRHFLGNTQNGYYLSAFARFAHFDGYVDYYEDNYPIKVSKSITDMGIGVGVGYRKFSYRGLYWGTSVNFGRYLFGDDKDILRYDNKDLYINMGNQILTIEFLKFGWAF